MENRYSPRYNEGYEDGKEEQREKDIKAAVMAFIALECDELRIIRLLRDYFHIKNIDEIEEYISGGKESFIRKKWREIEKYLMDKGMDSDEALTYMNDHNVRNQLERDTSLLIKSADAIIETLKNTKKNSRK